MHVYVFVHVHGYTLPWFLWQCCRGGEAGSTSCPWLMMLILLLLSPFGTTSVSCFELPFLVPVFSPDLSFPERPYQGPRTGCVLGLSCPLMRLRGAE